MEAVHTHTYVNTKLILNSTNRNTFVELLGSLGLRAALILKTSVSLLHMFAVRHCPWKLQHAHLVVTWIQVFLTAKIRSHSKRHDFSVNLQYETCLKMFQVWFKKKNVGTLVFHNIT